MFKLFSRKQPALINGPVSLDDDAFFADPYPIYERLRRYAPIAEVRSGGYVLTRHEDVRAGLSNPALGNAPSRFSALHARFRDSRVAADLANNILPFQDKPAHTLPRKLISRAFLQEWGSVEGQLEAWVDNSITARRMVSGDVLAEVVAPTALANMARFLGLPAEDTDALARYSDAFFRLFAPVQDGATFVEANAHMAAFREVVAAHLGTESGLIARLRKVETEGERLTEQVVIDTAILIFSDGIENVVAGVANTIKAVREAGPKAEDRLQTDPEPVVREALRLDSPAQLIPRVARSDCEILGQNVNAGTPVFLALGSANRDPAGISDPDTFDPDRDQSRVLTFGGGRHSCIGAGLARAHIASLSRGVMGHYDVPDQRFAYQPRFGHRWPQELMGSLRGPP